ncbi:MAG: hypothetical protein IT561_26040 [Alphaproteobacteria bacterium]|nr:hypothetical protein [Alphaproteobacteria bacterium]
MHARLMLGLLVALVPAAAAAQHAASGAHLPGVHGGVVEDLGPYHAEVVAKGGDLVAYLFDGKMRVVDTAGAKAKATIQAGGKATSIELSPSEPNLLKGSGAFAAGKGTKVVLFLTMPGQKTVQGRFANPE